MLGIMNVGSDSSVEFYATARRNSLYSRKPSKGSRTYSTEGRVFINGVPEYQDSPDDLWRSLITRAVTGEAMKDVTRKNNGPLAVIRRFSSRLGFGKSPSVLEKAPEECEKDDESKKHVTIVRIKTMRSKPHVKVQKRVYDNNQSDESDKDDSDDDEVRIYAEESILKRLMEEKAIFEREMGEISMEWATDKDPETIDEENDIVVERF